ncbi:MAG: BON domain-containing protein [Candidatus Binatus sp.]|uniref:BON domain-containing protein n=1 Tax=Candidatus Binatus sp. TaxID=2811406 RepID=UPI003C72E222
MPTRRKAGPSGRNRSADSIKVSTRNSVVTLEGVAPNRRQAEMAEADAWYIFGVDGVIDHLRAAKE